MTTPQNVLILTSNTGGGHRSAALALQDSFYSLHPGQVMVKITQVLEEANMMSRKLGELYNYLLRHHQQWMKYYYWAIQSLKPNESKFIFEAALGYGMQLFERYCPNVIVSVHPMTNHFFSYVLRKLHLIDKIPLVTVVTDPCYGFWRGWACDDVRHYYVATHDAKQQLMDYGVASHKIETVGMPVHRRFHPVSYEEKRAIRQSLGLDPDKYTVFLNAGWVGGGNIPKIYEALIQSPLDVQAVFLAGRNEKLAQDATLWGQSADFPVHVVGFTNEIHQMMNAADIMVSKLGGLTTFEALASGLPIIADTVTPPMPQEEQTVSFVEKTQTGLLLDRPDQIVSVIQSLQNSPEQMESLRHAAQTHGKPGAADHIAHQILHQFT